MTIEGEKMKIYIAGLGLIGGSFAKAALAAGHEVSGWDLDPAVRESAKAAGVAVSETPDAPVVIAALPPKAVVPWVESHAAGFAAGTVVMDVCGVKRTVCEALRRFAFSDWNFIGGHPMAGRELGGWERSDADLFKGASMILTPYPSCGRKPLDMLEAFFAGLGFARTVITTPEHHDEMIALTSQLAHVVSSAYVRDPLAQDHRGYSAGSFQDMTRVSTVDPDVWTSLFLSNADPLSEVLGRLIARLGEYKAAIDSRDADALRAMLAAGRDAKMSCG